jgi:type IV pilus assembly protein PilY1
MAFCDNRSSTSEQCQDGDLSRLDYLKQGMVKLLQGSSADGVEPLADRLVVGLSEFSALTGRIKLEARPLGESTTLSNRPIFQTVQTFTQPASSSISQSKTSTTNQTKTETGTRLQNCGTNKKSWCDVSTVSNWQLFKDWSPEASSTSGSWTPTAPDWSLTGTKTASGAEIPQECIDWNANGTSCTYWESTIKTVNDFGSVISNESSSTPSYSGVSSVTYTPSTDGTQSGPSYDGSSKSDSCASNKATCTRTATRTATITSTRTASQTSTATFTVTTTYYGTATETHRKKMLRAVKALNAAGGTPTAFAYAEVAAYLMGTKTSGNYSGFSANVANISNSTSYIKPSAYNAKLGQREYTVDSSKSCNTQGIYFLTDGVPEYGAKDRSAAPIMRDSLNDTNFSCSAAYLGGKSYYPGSQGNNNTNNWTCIGNYTKRLLNGGTDNPAGVSIRTAVVGFGGIMSASNPTASYPSYANDIAEAKAWGVLGGGGFYQGSDDNAVVQSVVGFLKTLQKYIPPVTTGSVTIPVDNLDTQNVQPWGYFPQFDPQPDSKVNTWIGNLKKYEVVNNVLLDRDGNNIINSTTKISVDDPNDFWADGSIKKTITKIKRVGTADIEEDIQVRVGGALSQFKLGVNASNNTERKIFTDRKIAEQTSAASGLSNDSNLVQVKTADLKVLNTANNFANDPKRGYIASLFGYDVGATMANGLETDASAAAQTNFANYLTNTNATLRQMGAVMHSKPVLITQSGTTSYNDKTGDLTYTDRDDLIVFGSTQGLLHIVRAGKTRTDSDAGKEVFAFMPNEMVDGQYQGFLNQTQQGNILKYGIDGQWTAYTEYVTKSGTKATEPVVTVKGGKQWLYGGLRMGGKSYYALDLSDVTSSGGTPKLKFRIDPLNSSNSAIRHMGQSWSKPTLTWVNWKGSRKLVMIVGGGYDTAYESLTFNPSSSIDQGAGVYMFDANDGSLLWWSSANVASSSTSNTETYAANMKRSVVSQIKAVDRNNDGLTDHLYFGDLGGQVWRVDLNASSKAGDTENFAKRAVRILNMSSATNVPRFYSAPTFTIHNSVNGYFGVVTIGSGNLSFPMSEANKDDALYVVYDKDVAKRNLSVLKESELSTVDMSTSATENGKKIAVNTGGNTGVSLTFGGWYYPLSTKNRMLNDNVAIDNDLYISVFDSTVDITDVDCIGGVRGKSVAKQFCLPFGQCMKKDSAGNNVSDTRPDDIELGRGNIGISFGGIDKKRGLVLNLPTDKTLKSYQGKTKFISQRWYER